MQKLRGEVASVEATEELPERQDVTQLDRYEMMGVLSSALEMIMQILMGHHMVAIDQHRTRTRQLPTPNTSSSTLLLATIIKSINSTIKDPLFVIVVVVLYSSPLVLATRDFPALALVAFRRLPYWPQKFPISQQRVVAKSAF